MWGRFFIAVDAQIEGAKGEESGIESDELWHGLVVVAVNTVFINNKDGYPTRYSVKPTEVVIHTPE